ncbi:MAG TPA: histidine phosphatase family protein [Candidatus Saccharimonadales bacterium]|nr:histidine phosphatase family protein [Candidatus Saccharimonadales bacterium]
MKLLYVRHGKTQGNVDKSYIGRIESPLLKEGIEDAKKVGKQIHSSGERIDVIYTSKSKRQLDTAQIIATEIGYPADKIVITDLLLERAGGDFEGKPQSEFFAMSEEKQIEAGAESFKDLADRAVAIVERAEAEYPNGTVLLVSSAAIGEMIRAMIKYSDHTRMFDDGPMPNTELVQLI